MDCNSVYENVLTIFLLFQIVNSVHMQKTQEVLEVLDKPVCN